MNGVRTQCRPWTELISARMPPSSVTQSESGAGITVTALLDVPVVVSLPARRNSTRERLPVVIWSSGQSDRAHRDVERVSGLASGRDVAADRHHDALRREARRDNRNGPGRPTAMQEAAIDRQRDQ